MRLHWLMHQIYHQPALILPNYHASIRALLEAVLEEGAHKREGEGECGSKVELPQMTIDGGIATIPVGGAIGTNLSLFEKGTGAVDTGDIAKEIDIAEADKSVHTILFEIDSPGGMVSGTPELSDKIGSIKKDKYAFTNGLMASAAYWIGSATDAIFATRTADIGSIGVYLPVYDQTKAYEKAGIKVELIKAGKLKGIGYPGTSLSEAAKEHLQSRINEIYEMFKSHVRANRGDVADETMQGQTFMAEQAMKRGLIDGIVRDKGELLNSLR
jgi:signal peptide peptidase SppA